MAPFDSLKARHSVVEPTADTVYENIDEFMTAGPGERPWQVFELTQNQDVTEWIRNPDRIELLQPILADLADRLKQADAPPRILDAGCYGGYVFDYLKRTAAAGRHPIDYTGIDIQESAIRDAREAHAHDTNARFQAGDIFRLSQQFPTARFDAVVCYRVLHHLPRFEDCLRELSAVSRGFVHTALPLKERSQCVRMQERNLDTGAITHSFFRHFCRDEIARTAEALNLQFDIASFPHTPYSAVVFSPAP